MKIKDYIGNITTLVRKGGPDKDEYDALNEFFHTIGKQVEQGKLTRDQIRNIRGAFGEAVSKKTMQGLVAIKPYGYAGDFEIIDKIYTKWISPYRYLAKWDLFFHSQKAPQAVRNRKEYFINVLRCMESAAVEKLKILSVGGGPAREIYEYCAGNHSSKTIFECVDMEPKAIAYAKSLCHEFADRVNFYCCNIFRFKTPILYDLVWSAGLFDYLDDKAFKFLLRHLLKMLCEGGQLIIGNFSTSNPSRNYMEFGEWFVNHRDESILRSLALNSGVEPENIFIEAEPEGVNLFLHIKV